MIRAFAYLVVSSVIAGCSWFPVRTIHDECVIDKPVRLTKAEFLSLSDESAKRIRQHNEMGDALCHWEHK